ncbi:hypothetical protein BMETH_748_1 [methanotrophic bacterial endosymbiont of Bathymodiolus sp.]|nr:hypothetical protein BMETH_748_1 [methanotrophic bacterial endosymbiont of Bathymodiolus sp.]
MGVFLRMVFYICRCISLPHARGGVSAYLHWLDGEAESSPRPWGCFSLAVYLLKTL